MECKRLKEGQAAGQEKEFSFAEALNDPYFTDVIIKSSDGCEVGPKLDSQHKRSLEKP